MGLHQCPQFPLCLQCLQNPGWREIQRKMPLSTKILKKRVHNQSHSQRVLKTLPTPDRDPPRPTTQNLTPNLIPPPPSRNRDQSQETP